MPTYTLSKTSPLRTTFTDPEGKVVYTISTPAIPGNVDTTIKRGDEVIATIHWKLFKRSTITMNERTTPIDAVFPAPRKLSTSRVYTMPNGERFIWKDELKLYCMSVDTDLNLATYYRNTFYLFNNKKSTLDISSTDPQLTDALIVTWAIFEKKARDRRRSTRSAH